MKTLSVIIPARNEEKFLPACLHAIQRAAEKLPCKLEIICVVNRSTDNTETIAKEHGCVVVKNESKNLSSIRNSGINKAAGDYIVTVDADSVMSSGLLKKIFETLETGTSIGGGVMIYPERYSLGIVLTALLLTPLIFWHRILGGVFFFRKEDSLAIGGFNEKLVSVEDIDFAKRLKAFGKKQGKKYSNIFCEYIVTSCRKFDHFGDWHFIKNPHIFLRLLKGTNESEANRFWYDIKR